VAVAPGAAPPLRIVNDVNGDVVIIAARSDEVAADAVETGTGGSAEEARSEAQEHMAFTNNGAQVPIQPRADAGGQSMNADDRAFLHVRVPPGATLSEVRARAGNIEIYGPVGDISAAISDGGNIEVLGGNGNVDLSTPNGSIRVDLAPGTSITARANRGNVDIFAVDAAVSASTSEGYVRFIGTLRGGQTHYFTTTAAGGIKVALPAYPAGHPTPQVYRYYVETATANPINVEYPARGAGQAALPICGFIHSSGPYDYHVEDTKSRTGRIEVSQTVTGTQFFTGTLATNYIRFDTIHTRVSFFTPLPQSIHIYTDAQLNEIIAGREPIAPECEAALNADSPNAIVLKMKTDSGPVYIHQMLTEE
jgi:hypothetical protein